jgi:hypothetical protein
VFEIIIIACQIVLIIVLFYSRKTKTEMYDGRMVLSVKEDGTKVYSLLLDEDPEMLEHKDVISFKVVHDGTIE